MTCYSISRLGGVVCTMLSGILSLSLFRFVLVFSILFTVLSISYFVCRLFELNNYTEDGYFQFLYRPCANQGIIYLWLVTAGK